MAGQAPGRQLEPSPVSRGDLSPVSLLFGDINQVPWEAARTPSPLSGAQQLQQAIPSPSFSQSSPLHWRFGISQAAVEGLGPLFRGGPGGAEEHAFSPGFQDLKS